MQDEDCCNPSDVEFVMPVRVKRERIRLLVNLADDETQYHDIPAENTTGPSERANLRPDQHQLHKAGMTSALVIDYDNGDAQYAIHQNDVEVKLRATDIQIAMHYLLLNKHTAETNNASELTVEGEVASQIISFCMSRYVNHRQKHHITGCLANRVHCSK